MTEGKGGLLTLIIGTPILALFVGGGIFAYNASATWTSADNQAVVTGLAAVCGSGIIVLGLMIALDRRHTPSPSAYGEAGAAASNGQSRRWRDALPHVTPRPAPRSRPARPDGRPTQMTVTGGSLGTMIPAPRPRRALGAHRRQR